MGKWTLFIVIYIHVYITCIYYNGAYDKNIFYYLKADREMLYMYLLIISSMIYETFLRLNLVI